MKEKKLYVRVFKIKTAEEHNPSAVYFSELQIGADVAIKLTTQHFYISMIADINLQ